MNCWGITDGSAGTVAQVKALAWALDIPVEMKTVKIRTPFAWLPNACFRGKLEDWVIPRLISKCSDSLEAPYPRLVISCGRRGAIAALGLKKRLRKQPIKFVHIQDPQVEAARFDLVVAMEHDKIKAAKNVIKIRYALHTITPASLEEARAKFAPRFDAYPKPYVGVLLGGSTNKYRLTPHGMQQIIDGLRRLASAAPGSLLITPSRRTGRHNIESLQAAFSGNPRVYIYDGQEENPYMGILALADTLAVTNDSVNMMSEAIATGKPVYILPLPGHGGTKPARFAERLIWDGIARANAGKLDSWNYPPPPDLKALAEEVKARLAFP